MITDRDIAVRAVAEGRDPSKTRVSEVMTPDVVYCYEDQDVAAATELMRQKQIRRLPIINRDKRLIGIVSLGDLSAKTGDAETTAETVRRISEPAQPQR